MQIQLSIAVDRNTKGGFVHPLSQNVAVTLSYNISHTIMCKKIEKVCHLLEMSSEDGPPVKSYFPSVGPVLTLAPLILKHNAKSIS